VATLDFTAELRYADGFTLAATFATADGITALFGPSGAGKSTVIALLAGLLRPHSGRIVLGDQVLVDTELDNFVPPEDRQIGVVFQDQRLFPHLTVRENLTFGLRRPPSADRKKTDSLHKGNGQPAVDFARLVKLLELDPFLDRMPTTLSGGQAQRVALGRALLHGRRLLLMDEPVSSVDERLKDRILTYLERVLAEWRVPTLFVSHDQADVRQLAEQVVVIDSGRVVAVGETAATLDRALLTQLQQPLAPINLLRVQKLECVGDRWQGQVGTATIVLPAKAAEFAGRNVAVQFLASDVMLGHEPLTGWSARNQFAGHVCNVVALADRTYVAVDIGQFIWAELTPGAVKELALTPGSPVICVVKTSALTIVG
jgi:molybdate transport system ATP-binding protein